jgi:hypothetical protein
MQDQFSKDEPKPVAFMVMPFRKRPVPDPPKGAPAMIDCNALWERAFRPALEALGYLPIRADMESGAVIVKDMLERLGLATLVLADMSLPNGNVYYEVGLRHAAKPTHCVLIAAEWSKQLFDTDQIRTHRYPLNDGTVPDEEAKVIRELLIELIPKMREAPTPYYELVKGKENSTVFRDQVERITAFQTQVRSIRHIEDKGERSEKVRELCQKASDTMLELPEVALDLVTLVRDSLGWEALIEYAENLPEGLQANPFIKEQVLLARSKTGQHREAIEGIKKLIEMHGDSPERRGLIGGSYKRLWRDARDKRMAAGEAPPGLQETADLKAAIENYSLGMELDYNEYYCACNLPLLLYESGTEDDLDLSKFIGRQVVRTCERKIRRGEDDGWAKPTLLVSAFLSQDLDKVNELALAVVNQGPAAWELQSALSDVDDALEFIPGDAEVKKALRHIRDQLVDIAEKG